MKIFRYPVFILCLLVTQQLFAATVVECEDAQGNRTFATYCPPDTSVVSQKTINADVPKPRQPDIMPVVYILPKCRACNLVRDFFQSRDINISIKNVENNKALKKELKGIIGNLRVPTIIIGDKVLSDYYPDQLMTALEEVGFTLTREKN